MSAFTELAIFCGDHPEIRAHKRIGELLQATAAELAQLKAKEDLLGNLLAILHRDGGHHEGEVGTEQAVKDAMKIYYQLRAELDEKNSALELIGDLAYDRDGWKSAEKLGELIDEIYGYARDTKKAAEINNGRTHPERRTK